MTAPASTDLLRRPDGGITRYRFRGAGDPLLLCAGTGYPLDTWPENFLEPLAEQFHVLEFDYRGTGGSPGTDGTYTTRDFAADAVAMLDSLGTGPCHVVGHSMGGRVAQWLARDAPVHVRSLVLVATGAGEGQLHDGQEAGVPLNTAVDMIELGYRGYLRRNIRRLFFTSEFLETDVEVCERLVEAFWMNRPSVRDYLKHVRARQEHCTDQVLAEIAARTLVLIGDRDSFVGSTGSHLEQSRYLADNLPNARLEFVAGAAHGVFWQKPVETANAILAFLQGGGRPNG